MKAIEVKCQYGHLEIGIHHGHNCYYAGHYIDNFTWCDIFASNRRELIEEIDKRVNSEIYRMVDLLPELKEKVKYMVPCETEKYKTRKWK